MGLLIYLQGFIQWRGWGEYPRHEFDMGGYPPHQLEFFGNFLSGFEKLITLSVILRHLEAELSILRCLKLIRGVFPLFFLNFCLVLFFLAPH
jgi:hypothetical protein